ncbi:MAG: SEC-C metal-binding domain-containing protein [candidate division KSB1 bacterium]
MKAVRRNDPCPCGSGKKYKNCCARENSAQTTPARKTIHFTDTEGFRSSAQVTSFDAIPTHNQNGLRPEITPEQMMDLCLDEIHRALATEHVSATKDLVDAVLREMDVVPTFTYRQIAERMEKDGRFSVFKGQLCSLNGTDPVTLMEKKLRA